MEKKNPGGPEPLASDSEALVPVTHTTNISEHLLCARHCPRCWKVILPSVLCFPISFPPHKPWAWVSWVSVTCNQKSPSEDTLISKREKNCMFKRKPHYDKLRKYSISYHTRGQEEMALSALPWTHSFFTADILGHRPFKPYLGVTCANHVQTRVGLHKLGWGHCHPHKQGSLEWRDKRQLIPPH